MNLHRAHVVGSLLRPPALIEAASRYRARTLDAAEFKKLEDRAVDDAVRVQQDSGIDLITDGEQRRLAFADVMAGAMGLKPSPPQKLGKAHGGLWHGGDQAAAELEIHNPTGGVIVEKLRRADSQAAEEFVYLRALARHAVKVTLPSPTMFSAAWGPDGKQVYSSFDAALDDICEILRQEVRALARLGCQNIQFDAPEVTFAIDAENSPVLKAMGLSQQAFCNMVVERLQSVSVEPNVTFSVHFCRGNARGLWHSAGGYDALSRYVFPRLEHFQYVLLEYDTDRAGTFDALRELPASCCSVLGLITTKSGVLEDAALIRKRIDDAARVRPLERLAVSPQCGFASDSGGNPLSQAEQQAKLSLVGQIAKEVWR